MLYELKEDRIAPARSLAEKCFLPLAVQFCVDRPSHDLRRAPRPVDRKLTATRHYP